MEDRLVSDLVSFGLSDKEARVYLALLELGQASANQIAEKSGVNRSSAYVVIESLKNKGVVGTVKGASVQEFFAISPEILTQAAASSVNTAQEQLERIKNILPELKGLHKDIKHRPKVRVFEGVNGLIQAMEETLNVRDKVLRTFTSGEMTSIVMSSFIEPWALERVHRKILLRGIFVEGQAARNLTTNINRDIKKRYEQNVYVPQNDYPFPVDVMIWDDSVGYLIVEDGGQITTIVLEAKEIGLVMKNMFDMAFEQAKLNGSYEEA